MFDKLYDDLKNNNTEINKKQDLVLYQGIKGLFSDYVKTNSIIRSLLAVLLKIIRSKYTDDKCKSKR